MDWFLYDNDPPRHERVKWAFYDFVKSQCMSTPVHVNGTVQFTFFLVMKLNINIVASCDELTVVLVP